VHNPAQIPDSTSEIPVVSFLISYLHTEGLFSKATPTRILQALGLFSSVPFAEGSQTVISEQATINDLTGGVLLKDISKEAYTKYLTSTHLLAREIGLRPGEQALVVNGRVRLVTVNWSWQKLMV
jgi:UDP-glucose:glycoprotein glucosyltransferase